MFLFTFDIRGFNIGSTARTPIRLRRSTINADFSLTSKGESHPNEGVKLTSNSHGFRVLSIKISNPKSSVNARNKINKITKKTFKLQKIKCFFFFTKAGVYVLDELLHPANYSRCSCQYGFYYNVLNSLHQFLRVVIVCPQVPQQS